MGTVVLGGSGSVRMESAGDNLLRIGGDAVKQWSFGGDLGETNSAAADEGRGG